ncbi:uncharacterized protein BO72DRAFT_453963 [Aspergillus fijiensis CBS 313.89]|uniref:DNA (cytosine-5)-methyltransferase 1 replication foci domain-containing protein n=1 Tax=Aspergillus fijiensis CBS 313.89 TaxID=1448319 RepID=A0A8G1RD96_9EURO|nr:uncharacterized protein BO72DRAFT_453963 [Aspergillus fijiensis CBS 313.89]RAK71165.1 hypothetical protein BO72DRAFT_453963 [Aspergillus fijiensis CBS 313.89]
MTSREDNVLAARDPALTDENEWEEFSLSEVRVLFPGKSRYANLLTASPDNPVQVTGCLDEVEEEQESLVLDPEYLTKRIVLENVTHYAYGQHNDGEVGFWVAGRAGWFSISPAKGYKPMFNEVVEAIDLLYFLADRHKRKRGRRKFEGPSVEYLFEEYVSHTHGICEDADDSAEVFYKHHNFLLSRMLKGEENVQWSTTHILAHLSERFPEDYEQIKAQIEGVDEVESEEEEESTPEKTDDEKGRVADSSGLTNADANSIYQMILDLKEEGYLAKRQLNLDLVASTLVDRFEIDDDEYAHSRIAASAEVILELMDEAKTSSFDWSRKVIYRELRAASKQHGGPSQEAMTPLRPRMLESEASSPEDSDQEDLPRLRKRRVLKSVLRPKSAVATKRTGKRTRSAAADTDEESDTNADAMDEIETPSKVRGHELVRDPLSTRAKRRTRSILSDSESTAPSIQKTSLQDVFQSRNTSVSAADIDAHPHEEPAANGTNGEDVQSDTWTCQVRGCGKVVYKCSTKRGKQLIEDHSLAHADDTKAKLDLVFAEQRLNIGLPVDNLLKRIREMAGGEDTGLADTEGAMNGASDAVGT